MDQDLNPSDYTGCQVVTVIGRVTATIPNSLFQRSFGVLLSVGWLSGTLVDCTLGSAGGSGVSVEVGGRELAIISCNSLISRSFSSPIEKGDNKDKFFTALAIS